MLLILNAAFVRIPHTWGVLAQRVRTCLIAKELTFFAATKSLQQYRKTPLAAKERFTGRNVQKPRSPTLHPLYLRHQAARCVIARCDALEKLALRLFLFVMLIYALLHAYRSRRPCHSRQGHGVRAIPP